MIFKHTFSICRDCGKYGRLIYGRCDDCRKPGIKRLFGILKL